MAHPLEAYLRELHLTRFVGVKETANYPALKALCDEVGKTLPHDISAYL